LYGKTVCIDSSDAPRGAGNEAVPFDDELLMIFSPDLSCTYLLFVSDNFVFGKLENLAANHHEAVGGFFDASQERADNTSLEGYETNCQRWFARGPADCRGPELSEKDCLTSRQVSVIQKPRSLE
jgi:hypothetical protein